MDDREQIQQQMLELIYGLLSDQESAELVDRISSDGQLAREYAELKEQTELLAEVAKAESSPPNYDQWKREADDQSPTPASGPAATWASRTLQVVAALAACLLVAALGYPMLSIDQQGETIALAKQKQSIANDFLSVSVTGPSLMAAEVRNDFFVSIENADAQPVDAEVEYTFKNPEGATVYYGLTKATNGQVVCQIPADEVTYAAKLEVVARHEQAKSTLDIDVKAAPPKPIAVLQTDREFAQPGEMLNFRAVVLDPQTNRDQPANVDFVYSVRNQGGLNRIASAERSTLQGVAQGQLQVPTASDLDNLELGVQSPQLQNNFQQRALPVMTADAKDSENLARLNTRQYGFYSNNFQAANGGRTLSQIAAKPEGGNLVAGVSNRVRYMATRDQARSSRAQMQVRGADAKQFAENDKPDQDYGYFDFVPQPMQDYTVEVQEENQAPLEEQIAQAQSLPAALQINNGVAPSDQPLEVEVRVAQPNNTLALVASDGYNTIGHNLWDVGVNAPITQPVQLDLPVEANGAQRVQLFSIPPQEEEASGAEPQLIAERIIYRIPVQRYDIAINGLPDQADPGQNLDVQISVTDEYENPAQATLGVQMERISDLLPQTQQPIGLEGEWFFNRRVQIPATAASLPEDIRDLEKDSAWFDQVLALSTWKEEPPAATAFAGGMLAMAPDEAESVASVPENKLPVMRRSNKKVVQSEYQQALAAIHADWESRLEDVRLTSSWMLTAAGGVLVICLIGLAIVQGMPKIGVWGPGLLVAAGAVAWGMFSLNLSLPEMSVPSSSQPKMVALNDTVKESPSSDFSIARGRTDEAKKNRLADGVVVPMLDDQAPEIAAGEMADRAPQIRPAVEMQRNAQPAAQKAQIELRSGPARYSQPSPDAAGMGAAGMGGGYGMQRAAPMSAPEGDARTESFGAAPRMMRSASQPFNPPAAPGNADEGQPQPEAANILAAEGMINQPTGTPGEIEALLPEPILWKPRLATNANGQVNIPVQLPQQPGRYRLVIDAHGSGRLGTIVRYVEVLPPKLAAPVPAPAKKASN